MLSFESDYIMGAHPEVLRRLTETNFEPLPGYGSDIYTESTAKKIREACKCPDADVHFLTGGTQTNSVIISTMLQNYEGVIAATTGHISGHEAGAIEATGHKVITLPEHNGKLDADEVKSYLDTFYADANHTHMVFPGMVYISHPTEYGTLYSKHELTRLAEVCRHYDIPLFMDGARLGYGLMSYQTDLSLPDIAALCDVFYIGGTKVGALCGEAVVFTHNNAPRHFLTMVKQHGALLAKGRLNSVQFDALFTDDLYFKISRHAIDMAEQLKDMFRQKGYKFFLESPTNQQFIILENEQMQKLSEQVRFSFWEKYDDTHTVVRFATAWSTTQEQLDELKAII
ncbi:MAG: aminotransferase class I/II-fold pyridoxal phosphate-dependent enzyme [Clostridia bacterium]|nr:aminotransferase class I/II-fold pyridoxal phosphate-dependent enzyme [Clostridia bacterium]